jgi:hypothetical protein
MPAKSDHYRDRPEGAELTNHCCSLDLILDSSGTFDSAVSGPESRKVHIALTAISERANINSFRLEIFKRSRYVKEALAAARNDSYWCSPQFCKISGDVHA